MPVSNSLDYCGFVAELEVGKQGAPCFILPSQDCFGYLGSFVVPMNFRIICSSLLKNAVGILIGIALNL